MRPRHPRASLHPDVAEVDPPAPVTGAVDLAAFESDGYVLLPGLVRPPEVVQLRDHIEAAALAVADDHNPLTLATMRFASNLFRHSAPLREFLGSPPVVDLVTSLLGPDVWARWDQAVWKGPDGPAFPWHQDNGYTQLGAMHLQLWLALTPMNEENGGLLLAPGLHRGPLPHRHVGNHVEIDPPDHPVAVVAEAGDVILFSSFLPHATSPNTTGTDRLAYVAEFLSVAVPDDSVEPPHLVVARDGRPGLRFEDLRPRWRRDPPEPDGSP